MDQILFLFDVEQLLEHPLKDLAGNNEDNLMEASLDSLKQAVLKIGLSCVKAANFTENKWDIPNFGFR